MTDRNETVVAFPEPHWVDNDDGSAFYLSRSGDMLCAVHPTSHGLWSFSSSYMRGQCETLDGAKAQAVRFLAPDDPLDGLDAERRELALKIFEKYASIDDPGEKTAFLLDIHRALGGDDTVVDLSSY